MNLRGRELNQGLRGTDVAELQRELAMLGFAVADDERRQSLFGPTTHRAVVAFQEQQRIAPAGVVNAATAKALSDELRRRGLLNNACRFKISGTVAHPDGRPAKRQRLLAADIDLRGAAVYRTALTLGALQIGAGAEILDEFLSDNTGHYACTFDCSRYGTAERKKADVVVFALDGEEIVGRSRLVNSEDYSDKGEVRRLDVQIDRILEQVTEYERVMRGLNALLAESRVSLADMARSRDQTAFAAGELDLEPGILQAAAAAEMLRAGDAARLSHELLYGLGRQQVRLNWPALYRKRNPELQAAIAAASQAKVIRSFTEAEIDAFLAQTAGHAVAHVLDQPPRADEPATDRLLLLALPERPQRLAFLRAVREHSGDGPSFWREFLPGLSEFRGRPELISALLLTQQLVTITGHHLPLIAELQGRRRVQSAEQLLELSESDWTAMIDAVGLPTRAPGVDDAERRHSYIKAIRRSLHAAFPTQKIALMLRQRELPLRDASLAQGVETFLARNRDFDFSTSRVHDFARKIEDAAPGQGAALGRELKRLQRVYQVSPDPEAMPLLLERGLDSAYAIAGIPRKSFLKSFANQAGGTEMARAIFDRAEYIAYANQNIGASIADNNLSGPAYVIPDAEALHSIPNYAELFGSPDLCECEHCRSVYSPAAYFVDLLRFLAGSERNAANESPLDILRKRRPDLLHLPLSCENTNTVIPYIDLANEVMEYYVANDKLDDKAAYDTGRATAGELRANPQHVHPEAYERLAAAVYPFNLPYHQPLDRMRIHGAHLRHSREEVLRLLKRDDAPATLRAIAAETLLLSPEDYAILTGTHLDGSPETRSLAEYYGYANDGELEQMAHVPEFLRRSGLTYLDLVELVKTRFVNPHQDTLDFVQDRLGNTGLDAGTLYSRLEDIESGAMLPADDPVRLALADANIGYDAFAQWVQQHLGEFRSVITLHQKASTCDLDTTYLRTLGEVYAGSDASGIQGETWSRIHRFIRLWRKLGWTCHDLDLALAAPGEADITEDTIARLSGVVALRRELNRPINQLATFWGRIDTYGETSLYAGLFLNKAVQRIDTAFEADSWNNYLAADEKLKDHLPAILAAFGMSDEDLQAVLGVAAVLDNGNLRALDPDNEPLSLASLSTLYRHVVLAKSLKLKVADCCLLIRLFGGQPFSVWDVQQEQFTGGSPAGTLEFCELAAEVRQSGFKPAMLQYVFTGLLPPDATFGLNADKAKQALRAIRETFALIEQDHPDQPAAPLTLDDLRGKLSLTYQPDIVGRLLGILDGSAAFSVLADANLDLPIAEQGLAAKFSYSKASGRLTAAGIMSDGERDSLKALPNATPSFQNAVDTLYAQPEIFLQENFGGVFTDAAEANAVLLGHLAQAGMPELDARLRWVHERYLPLLKRKLRADAVVLNVATLIGLAPDVTARLIEHDLPHLTAQAAAAGYSATYFGDPAWSAPVLERTDPAIRFDWAQGSPDPSVPPEAFSVRWSAFLAPPASGERTLIVDVREPDDAFRLHLDDALILEKPAGHTTLSWEVDVLLNSAKLHKVVLDYAETAGQAGVTLRWKQAISAPETVTETAAYPVSAVESFVAAATLYHRAARFIDGFELDEREVGHLKAHAVDFAGLDFKALQPGHWRRIQDYVTLRAGVPQSRATLVDVLAEAGKANPPATLEAILQRLHLATGWDKAVLGFLAGTHFQLTPADFRNELALLRLDRAVRLARSTGIPAGILVDWARPEAGFEALATAAQALKNAVKAKYEEEDWLALGASLSDSLRRNQQGALISYLLTRPELRQWGVVDGDSLFEYFLIDVQMGACMDTSRVVQANASVQLFVSRCQLNLESVWNDADEETGVAPDAIDAERWEWMKNYRVWEANRKVFLYPENWLLPEWRDDRSPFFKEFESELTQNDITARSVETAFRNYLAKLATVANLELCGLHEEKDDKGYFDKLHVVGRTRNVPYKYFYRSWNKHQKWSAWEPIQVDIRGVEDGGNSGVHVVPVAWNKRLFVFWPEFQTVPQPASGMATQTADAIMNTQIGTLNPSERWEVKLSWTEFFDGKWTATQLTNQVAPGGAPGSQSFRVVLTNDDDLLISPIVLGSDALTKQAFSFANIESKPALAFGVLGGLSSYGTHFMARRKNAPLAFSSRTYLGKSNHHHLLFDNQVPDWAFEPTRYPFFYFDALRTYFVKPRSVPIDIQIKHPELHWPQPGIVDDSWWTGPGSIMPDSGDPWVDIGILGGIALADAGAVTPFSGSAVPYMAYNQATPSQFALSEAQVSASAFGGIAAPGGDQWMLRPTRKVLEFHTFHHPYASRFVSNLNRDGVPGLLESDTALPSDKGERFVSNYQPSPEHVPKPADFDSTSLYAERTYYKELVCFDVFGANSLYNWELFFHAPLYIAMNLSRAGKYKDAMQWFHYIFDPTSTSDESGTARYWRVRPFKDAPHTRLEEEFRKLAEGANPAFKAAIREWRDDPFRPHLVARNRPIAYMKFVVLRYVENLVAWGDSLFRQDTMESINEATQYYVLASHILGPRPQVVPKRGEIRIETYASLATKWDEFSNALVELENIFPYSSESPPDSSNSGNFLGAAWGLYFCIPNNEKLLEAWDTVADRLFKIRHCMNIDGVERQLALFAPPIDPAVLINAVAKGLSISAIMADLSSPPPIHRFSYLLQRATDFCAEVKALGNALLSAWEKRDSEELSVKRALHETSLLAAMTEVRERQVLEAKANASALLKGREFSKAKLEHYLALIDQAASVPDVAGLDEDLTANTPLPADTSIALPDTVDYDNAESEEEPGLVTDRREKEELSQNSTAHRLQMVASGFEAAAGFLHFIPDFEINGEFWGVGTSTIVFGGTQAGLASSATGKGIALVASHHAHQSASAGKSAGFFRRQQDWTYQTQLAKHEIIQIDKQIQAADIRIQIAERELEHHKTQIVNADEINKLLAEKFSNVGLYESMIPHLETVYKHSYNLAYALAARAEKAYRYEVGDELANFIQVGGYWNDGPEKGFLAGERLHLALRQMEKAYLELNRRELEMTKHISLAQWNPLALVALRETGKCYLSVREEWLDLDYQGHYFRRIKSVSITLPCVTGPYTTINCTLRLLKNTIRTNTSMNNEGNYEHENDAGLWTDDDRFRTVYAPVTAIATSTGQRDSGLFELNFRDERYLPFEGAGAVSEWAIELTSSTEPAKAARLRQFDYSTISDIILHINYTARDAGGAFKEKCVDYLNRFLDNTDEFEAQPLIQSFRVKHDFPGEWHRFLHPTGPDAGQLLGIALRSVHFPFITQGRDIRLFRMRILTKARKPGPYSLLVSGSTKDGEEISSLPVSMAQVPDHPSFGNLHFATLVDGTSMLNIGDLDVFAPMTFRLSSSEEPAPLETHPDEVEDMWLVFEYSLGP